jgi:hypothetical protein
MVDFLHSKCENLSSKPQDCKIKKKKERGDQEEQKRKTSLQL